MLHTSACWMLRHVAITYRGGDGSLRKFWTKPSPRPRLQPVIKIELIFQGTEFDLFFCCPLSSLSNGCSERRNTLLNTRWRGVLQWRNTLDDGLSFEGVFCHYWQNTSKQLELESLIAEHRKSSRTKTLQLVGVNAFAFRIAPVTGGLMYGW